MPEVEEDPTTGRSINSQEILSSWEVISLRNPCWLEQTDDAIAEMAHSEETFPFKVMPAYRSHLADIEPEDLTRRQLSR